MPRTQEVLDKVLETAEEFQIRRIKHIANLLRESNTPIKEWELIRAAGLRKEYVEKHKEIIEKEIFGTLVNR